MRTIFIGDVHGCLSELEELLSKLSFGSGDDLIFLGDLMDRGPDPVGVVRLVKSLGARSVLGNHDEKHVRWARHEAQKRTRLGYRNPMKPFGEKMFAETNALQADEELSAWLRNLPKTIRVGDWIAVHAGFEPNLPLDAQREDKLLCIRYVHEEGEKKGKMAPIESDIDQPPGTVRWATVWSEPVHAVYGHHAKNLSDPMIDEFQDAGGKKWFRYGIDTACCFGGRLTAMVVKDLSDAENVEFVSVPARAKYAELWKGK